MTHKAALQTMLAVFFCFLIALPALAAEQPETLDRVTRDGQNRYGAGMVLTYPDAIGDDLYAAGQQIIVTGRIGGDVGAAAGTVEITGPIAEDVRIAGQYLTVASPDIGGNLVAAGQNIVFRSAVNIRGDAWVYGSFVELKGKIGGNLKVVADQLIIDAPIAGDAEITANRISFGERGSINGKLTLRAPENVPDEKVSGEIAFTPTEKQGAAGTPIEREASKLLSPWSIFGLFVSLIFGFIFLAVFRPFGILFATSVKANPFVSMGIGFLALIAIPVAFVLLLVTLIGMPIAFLLLFLYLALLIFVGMFDGLVIGSLLFPFTKAQSLWHLFGAFTVGTFFTFLLGVLPYFGPVLQFLIFLTALGTLLRVKYDLMGVLRKAKKI